MRLITLLLTFSLLAGCEPTKPSPTPPPAEATPAPASASAEPVVGAEAAAAYAEATANIRPVAGEMFSAMDALN